MINTRPLTYSPVFGRCPSGTHEAAIATTGASSTYGATAAEQFRASSALKTPCLASEAIPTA